MFGDINRSLKPRQVKIFLCKPDMGTIAKLSDSYNIKLTTRLADLNEISFSMPFMTDIRGQLERNPRIDLIRERYLLKVVEGQKEEYFVVTEIKDSGEDDGDSREIKAWSLGYELRDKMIRNYSNVGITAKEAMQDALYGTIWNIGENLSNTAHEFNSTGRSFDVSSKTILDFIQEIAESFEAITVWDTKNRTIDFENKDKIGQNKGLKVSYGKYLQSIGRESNTDEMVTRLTPFGQNQLTVHSYNPTGSGYIEDFSYFMYPFERDANKNVIKSSNYMSDSLCHAILDYKALVESKEGEFSTLLNSKLNKQEEKSQLENDLYFLQEDLTIIEDRIETKKSMGNHHYSSGSDTLELDADIKYGVVAHSDADVTITVDGVSQTLYANTYTLVGKLSGDPTVSETFSASIDVSGTGNVDIETLSITKDEYNGSYVVDGTTYTITDQEIVDKYSVGLAQRKYNDKELQVDSKQSEIDVIDGDISTLQSTLSLDSNFTVEQLIERNQFIIEKEWRNDNIYETGTLYEEAKKQFNKIRKPQVVIDIDIINFLEVVDAQRDWDKLVLGDEINIEYENLGVSVKAKIIEIDYDIEDRGIKLKIANVKDVETDEDKFIKALYGAVSTSTTVNMSRYKWNDISDTKMKVDSIIDNAWDATKQKIIAGTNESVEISRRGMMIKNPDDPEKYLVANHAVLAITRSGGRTWEHAITTDGIIGDRIIGKIFIGENLLIENSGGTFKVDHNGVTVSGTSFNVVGSDNLDKTLDQRLIDSQADAESYAKDYYDTNIVAVNNEISQLDTAVNDATGYIHTTFRDGVIDDSEKLAIAEHLKRLNNEKEDVDKRYSQVYSNPYLKDESTTVTDKTDLYNAKLDFDTKHNDLVNAINTATSDTAIIDNERANVESKSTAYGSSLGILSDAFEKAIDFISKAKSDEAMLYTDQQISEVNKTTDSLGNAIDDISSDLKITRAESESLKIQLGQVEKESTDVINVGTGLGITTEKDNYSNALSDLQLYLSSFIDQASYPIDITTTQRSTIKTKFETVQDTKSVLINKINSVTDSNTRNYIDQEVVEINKTTTALGNSIDDLSSDLKVTRSEANSLEVSLSQVTKESEDIINIATSLAIVTEKDAYQSALDDLTLYLGSFINQVSYPIDITDLQRQDMKTKFETVQDTKSKLIDKITDTKDSNLKTIIDQDISDVQTDLNNTKTYIDTTFHDGVISEAESINIAGYLKGLGSEKSDVDSKYQNIYNNSYLKDSTIKGALNTSHTNFVGSHDALVTSINDAILDGSVTQLEKDDVDAKFTDYESKLGSLSDAFEDAIDNITDNKKKEAMEYSAFGSLYTRGTGLNRDGSRILKLNDNIVYSHATGRGLRLTALDRSDLSIYQKTLADGVTKENVDYIYDVYLYPTTEGDKMATELNNLSDNVIVVITSYDAIKVSDNLASAIERCGGTGTKLGYDTHHRMPYALVGIPKIGHGAGLEVFTGSGTADPFAEISTKVVDGIPQGVDTTRKVLYDNSIVQVNEAKSDAKMANDQLSDISNDDILTSQEKSQVKKEWQTIESEKPIIDGQSTAYNADTSTEQQNYTDAYNALNTYLNGTSGVIVDMTVDTSLGTGGGQTFRDKFKAYYDAKVSLLKYISRLAKFLADNAQGTADTARDEAKEAREFFQKSQWKYEGLWNIPFLPNESFVFSSIPKKYKDYMELRLHVKDLEGGLTIYLNNNALLPNISEPDLYNGWTEVAIDPTFINTNSDNTITFAHDGVDDGAMYAIEMAFDSQKYSYDQAKEGRDAWGKFSGLNNTLPKGSVEFNFADSTSQGGNAKNTDAVGNQTAIDVQDSTINFNARNDRDGTPISNPTVAIDGTAIDHTPNTDGSVNISFEWTGVPDSIDGYIVYVMQSSSNASYTFGTSTNAESVYYVTPDREAIFLHGVPAEKYYTFGVQAYRIVDPDKDATGVIKSAIVQPTETTEDPYDTLEAVAFNGNITGTIGTGKTSADLIESQANNSLQEGTLYNNVKIDTTSGLVATLSNDKRKTIVNATDGLKIQGKNASGLWENRFYAEATTGIIYANGLVISDEAGSTVMIDAKNKKLDLSAFTTVVGALEAKNITVGSNTNYENDLWNPSKKETPSGALAKANASSARQDIIKVRYIRDWLNGSTSNAGSHWVEIQAISEGVNVAYGKTVTGDGSITNISRVTDGNTDTNSYYNAGSGLFHVQIDLGSVYENIEYVNVWHYYADGRTYNATKTEVSEDGINWIVLHDSGESSSGKYKETSSGNSFVINSATSARSAENNAKSHANNKDTTLRGNLNLTEPVDKNVIEMNSYGITAKVPNSTSYARLDHRGIYIYGGGIQIDGGLGDGQIKNSGNWNTAHYNATKTNLNLIKNGGAEVATGENTHGTNVIPDHWSVYDPNGKISAKRRVGDSHWTIHGDASFEINSSHASGAEAGTTGSFYQDYMPKNPTKNGSSTFTVSADIGVHRCAGYLEIFVWDSAGNKTHQTVSHGSWKVERKTIKNILVPDDVTKIRVEVRKGETTSGHSYTTSYLFVDNIKLEEGGTATPYTETDLSTSAQVSNGLQKDTKYNGVKINPLEGLVVSTSDNSIHLNANDGIRIKKGTSSVLWLDTYGNLNITGNITMNGGSISWSGVNAPNSSQVGAIDETYIDANGIWTGRISANTIDTGTLDADLVGIKSYNGTSGYSVIMDTYGIRLTNGTTTKIKIGTDGNITMNGGSISWSGVNAPDYTQVGGTKPPTNANNTYDQLSGNTSIKGFYYNSGTGKLELNADNISAGTIYGINVIGSTVKTANTGTRVQLDSGFADTNWWHGSYNILEVYDGVSYARVWSPDGAMYLGGGTTYTYPDGNWDFGYANVTGLSVPAHDHDGRYVKHFYSGDTLEVYVNSSNEWVVYKGGSFVGKVALV